ncbi:MAG: periplasmic heavy metal sensor [Ferrovibrio sp.]|uniref:periplasmic heavy metal sensor n=1 Tax=Ferrovibrio sp. TaxID=1917215 RepID=UPI00391DF2C0
MADPNITPPPAAPAPKSRINRWLAIGLIASVAINLAFVGWGAVRFVKYSRWMDRDRAHIEEQFARRLPDDAGKAFRKAFEKAHKGNALTLRDMSRELGTALAAEPYDRARLEAALLEHRRRLDQLQQGLQAGLLAAADAMTPEERAKLAQRLMRHGPPMPPPPDGPMGGPGGSRHMDGPPPHRLPPPPQD